MDAVRLRRPRWREVAGETSLSRCPEAGFSIESLTDPQNQAVFHGLLTSWEI